MACCILAAMLISQMIIIWKTWRRRIYMIIAALLTSVALAAQAEEHWHHISTFTDDVVRKIQGQPEPFVLPEGQFCGTPPINVVLEQNY